jgi:hypothetical protein
MPPFRWLDRLPKITGTLPEAFKNLTNLKEMYDVTQSSRLQRHVTCGALIDFDCFVPGQCCCCSYQHLVRKQPCLINHNRHIVMRVSIMSA